MYYKDLSSYEYFMPNKVEAILNVGWLDKEHEFEQGDVPPQFIEKLYLILVSDDQLNCRVNQRRGVHPCHLCGVNEFSNVFIGSCQLWIPSGVPGKCFASPSAIIHYIQDHHYRPPQVFIDAVLQLDLGQKFNGQNLRSEILGIPKHLWESSTS